MEKNLRFKFGKNWKKYSGIITESTIEMAKKSLMEWLPEVKWNAVTFLDIGSGSGLFSLAAKNLGARVYSFDYDLDSVECTRALKNKFLGDESDWIIEQGDILDENYIHSLIENSFNVVYSWGVLHHTGNMDRALDNAEKLVKQEKGSKLFISIYNDQGKKSIWWRKLKKYYNCCPDGLKFLFVIPSFIYVYIISNIFSFISHPIAFIKCSENKKHRGMNKYYDMIDWLGGYPFEVAKPEIILDKYVKKGYKLLKMYTWGAGLGCNQYVFEKE